MDRRNHLIQFLKNEKKTFVGKIIYKQQQHLWRTTTSGKDICGGHLWKTLVEDIICEDMLSLVAFNLI